MKKQTLKKTTSQTTDAAFCTPDRIYIIAVNPAPKIRKIAVFRRVIEVPSTMHQRYVIQISPTMK